MERYQRGGQEELFNLSINETAKGYMLETARWAKFLAIVGLIVSLLLLLGTIFILFNAADVSRQFGTTYGIGFGIGMFVLQLLSVLMIAYPSYTLLQFARKIVPAIDTANQEQLNNAFRNLKNTFKFWGILMLVLFGIYGLIIIFLLIGTLVAGL